MLLFLHIFQKQTCCYLKSCFEGKQKPEMCLSGDMQGGKFPSIRESLLLRNLWWCFWCLAIMQRVFAEWHLISNIGLRLSRLQRSWVQKELVLLHQEKEASRCALVIWVSASARDSCSRLVMLRKWSGPFNWGTSCATTAARRHLALHSEWSTATAETGKIQKCTCKNVHNVSEKGAITGKSM